MPVAAVGSNVLIDYKDTSSDRHARAEALVAGFDTGDLPAGRGTNYVLLETLNWIHTRKRHDIAVDLRQRLAASAGFELIHAAQADSHRALDLFKQYDQLSFGDATIAAYMDRTDIEYPYSFDDGFDQLDCITRLDTADNPFA